jgi:hypothetical protein
MGYTLECELNPSLVVGCSWPSRKSVNTVLPAHLGVGQAWSCTADASLPWRSGLIVDVDGSEIIGLVELSGKTMILGLIGDHSQHVSSDLSRSDMYIDFHQRTSGDTKH